MPLSNARREQIRIAIAAGRQPKHNPTRTVLPIGAVVGPDNPEPSHSRSYVVLSDHRGLTPAGDYFYDQIGGEAPDRKIDLTQQPMRQGDSEFAWDRRGRLVRLRTLTC